MTQEKTIIDLIPPMKLCKTLPEEAFEDSVFVWLHDSFQSYPAARELIPKDFEGYVYPAPTLDEIMSAISKSQETQETQLNSSTIALFAWFELNK